MRALFGSFSALSMGLLCGLSPGPAPAQITWETAFHAAMDRARETNKVVVAALNMDGERANDEMVAVHYRDARIVELSRHTINLFCSSAAHGTRCTRVSGITCAQHQQMDIRVRLDILKAKPDEWVVAPQHVFISPDGVVLSSVPYHVTPGELEWMWVDAIRRIAPDFAWKLGDRTRAPRRMKLGATESAEQDRTPPSREQVAQMLKDIKRGWGSFRDAADRLPILVRHEGEAARTFTRRLLAAHETRTPERCKILRIIGANSPRSWWNIAAPYLAHEEERVRAAAAAALEHLGEKRALQALKTRWKKETSVAVRGRVLRAMAASAPDSKRVIALLPDVIRNGEQEELRAQATLAAAVLEDREAIAESMTAALRDCSARVRATAAYAIAVRREQQLLPGLRDAIAAEADAVALRWMQAAEKVLGGADPAAFDGFVAEVLGEDGR